MLKCVCLYYISIMTYTEKTIAQVYKQVTSFVQGSSRAYHSANMNNGFATEAYPRVLTWTSVEKLQYSHHCKYYY